MSYGEYPRLSECVISSYSVDISDAHKAISNIAFTKKTDFIDNEIFYRSEEITSNNVFLD